VAERVRRRIESLQVSDGGALVRLSASVGVAIYPRHGTELDTLIRAADRALYAAKDAGRNAVRVALMSVRAA
jgi:diguanylate cyclase